MPISCSPTLSPLTPGFLSPCRAGILATIMGFSPFRATGVTWHVAEKASPGFTLFALLGGPETWLIEKRAEGGETADSAGRYPVLTDRARSSSNNLRSK